MELRHLRYFVAVAEERHFGRAAQRLHMAQPPLSRQIQALERELGFSLFQRTRRGVELTPAGASFLDGARRVFLEADRAVIDARRASTGETGRLVVGYLASLAYSGLTRLLRAYREQSPLVEMQLRELSPQEQLEALKQGRIDVGFVRGPVDDPSLSSERVRKERLFAALPSDHPLANRARLSLENLATEPFVTFPRARATAFFDSLMALCRAAGFTPRIVQEAPQLDIVSLVAAGFGVAILPESLREIARPDIALVPLSGTPTIDLLAAWMTSNGSPAVRMFLELMRRVGVGRASSR
jgi:DNA-binding transcriptional LysR family regulator